MNRLFLTIGLVMVVMMGLVSACAEGSDVVHVNANVRKASLVEIWEAVVEEASVQDTTASLLQFTLWLSEDGTVDSLYCMFYARDAEGRAGVYLVNSEYGGDVCYTRYSADAIAVPAEAPPLILFEELNKVPVTNVLRGQASANIMADLKSISALYGSVSDVTLWELKNGELVPLKEVSFSTNVPYLIICVSRYGETAPRSAEFWFLAGELEKAESVEYA